MQSIVSINNKKGRNKYIKFERSEKLFNFFKDIGIISLINKNMNNKLDVILNRN